MGDRAPELTRRNVLLVILSVLAGGAIAVEIIADQEITGGYGMGRYGDGGYGRL